MGTEREQGAPGHERGDETDDRRASARRPLDGEALIRELDGDGHWSPCRLVDLSAEGAAVEMPAAIGTGARVLLRLLTSDGVTPAYQLCGTVARAGEVGLCLIGIEFDRMPGTQHEDLDAFARRRAA